MEKKHLRLFSIALFTLGIIFLINSKISATGAAIGPLYNSTFGTLFGILLLSVSIILFSMGESLERRLEVKYTILQSRKDGYHLFNTKTGESYSLTEVKGLSEDAEMRTILRNEYFSDLLRLYASSPKESKYVYKQFIEALSPHSSEKHLEKRLKQFENVYDKVKDKMEFMNPERVKNAKPSDFSEQLYVRFENEKDTLWPEEGENGFLPFDEVKVNPSRGPLFSVIPVEKLIRDGYLLKDGVTLNGKWSPDQRQNYLKKAYGIDIGSRQRRMVFFQLEKDAELEQYRTYENIVLKKKVPLVKVLKKK